MPIGTIIGWLIGQIFIGIMIMYANRGIPKNNTETAILTRQVMHVIGLMFCFTGLAALIGTIIELMIL